VPSCTARLIHIAGAVATFSFAFADTESVDPPAGGRVSGVTPNREARPWAAMVASWGLTEAHEPGNEISGGSESCAKNSGPYPQFPTWVHETRTRPTKHKAKSSRKVLKGSKKGLAETAKGGRTGAQRRSFFRLANKTEGRQNNDFTVSLAAASCCSSGADPWS